MASLVDGYTCPICGDVTEEEFCSEHPENLMDLHLDNRYVIGSAGTLEIMQWDESRSRSHTVCLMPGEGNLDEDNAHRIATALCVTSEISSEALEAGYIQTLQQLPLFATDYLNFPNPETKKRLYLHLACIESRGRINRPVAGDNDDPDSHDGRFDLLVAENWKTRVWDHLVKLLISEGYTADARDSYSKKLQRNRIGHIYLAEKHTKNSLRLTARIGICHEILIATMQATIDREFEYCFDAALLPCKDSPTAVFRDSSTDASSKFFDAIISRTTDFFSHHQGLSAVLEGQLESKRSNPYVIPVLMMLLGKKEDAEIWIHDCLDRWDQHAQNKDFVRRYNKNFAPRLRLIKPVV